MSRYEDQWPIEYILKATLRKPCTKTLDRRKRRVVNNQKVILSVLSFMDVDSHDVPSEGSTLPALQASSIEDIL